MYRFQKILALTEPRSVMLNLVQHLNGSTADNVKFSIDPDPACAGQDDETETRLNVVIGNLFQHLEKTLKQVQGDLTTLTLVAQ